MQGACGYGLLDKSQYPYWSVAALSLTNSFSVAGPAHACGMCFEIKCVDIGGPFAVRPAAHVTGADYGVSLLQQCRLVARWLLLHVLRVLCMHCMGPCIMEAIGLGGGRPLLLGS